MQLDTSLRIRGRQLDLSLRIPEGAASGDFLVPVARELSRHIIQIVEEDAQAEGNPVTCRAGCGACCRQMVPVSGFEARRLAALVDAMDEPRRSEVRARFAAAVEAMQSEGIHVAVSDRAARTREHVLDYAWRYFRMGVACPFLEQESCSIYEERPLVCREYLVTSPPVHCADPKAGGVRGILPPASHHAAMMAVDAHPHPAPMLALVQVLQWARDNPEAQPTVPAAEQARLYFSSLTGQSLPSPGAMGA